MALYAYRRQEFLRDICYLVGYNRRNLWVVRTEAVHMLGAQWTGSSRIDYSTIRISPLKVVSTGKDEHATVALDENIVVAAQPWIRGRRGTMLLFVHPQVYDKYKWSSRKAPPLRLEELNALRGTKAVDSAMGHIGAVVCIHRELLTPLYKRTDRGTALLLAHSGRKVLGPHRKQV